MKKALWNSVAMVLLRSEIKKPAMSFLEKYQENHQKTFEINQNKSTSSLEYGEAWNIFK